MRFFCQTWVTLVFVTVVGACAGQERPLRGDTPPPPNRQLDESLTEARDLFVQSLNATGKDRVDGLRLSYAALEKAVEANPELSPARTLWAKMLIQAGDQKSARAALQRATAEQSDDPEAYVLLANMAAVSGQLTEARLIYNEANRLILRLPDGHSRRKGLQAQVLAGRAAVADARMAQSSEYDRPDLIERYSQVALVNLREWTQLQPDNPAAHERLGETLLRSGDVEAATKAFDIARRLNPALPVTDLRLAKSFFLNGDRREAMKRLERAVAAYPNDLAVRLVASDLLLSMGTLDAARKQIDAALSLDAENHHAQLLDVQWLRSHEDWERATELLQVLNTRHPTDFEIANLLALTLAESDEAKVRRRAVALATVNAQRFSDLNTPTGRRARLTLTWTALVDGQGQAAKESLNQLLAVGIQSNQVSGDEAYFAARLLVEFGRPELALALVNAALGRPESFPKRVATQDLQARLQ